MGFFALWGLSSWHQLQGHWREGVGVWRIHSEHPPYLNFHIKTTSFLSPLQTSLPPKICPPVIFGAFLGTKYHFVASHRMLWKGRWGSFFFFHFFLFYFSTSSSPLLLWSQLPLPWPGYYPFHTNNSSNLGSQLFWGSREVSCSTILPQNNTNKKQSILTLFLQPLFPPNSVNDFLLPAPFYINFVSPI